VGADDFRVVLSHLDGGDRTTRDRLIPSCLFIDPELAHVGLTESEAQAKGVSYRLVKQPMAFVLRTRTLSQTRGFAKALIGTDDRILGFTAFGADARPIAIHDAARRDLYSPNRRRRIERAVLQSAASAWIRSGARWTARTNAWPPSTGRNSPRANPHTNLTRRMIASFVAAGVQTPVRGAL
jgi:hypothetical protein